MNKFRLNKIIEVKEKLIEDKVMELETEIMKLTEISNNIQSLSNTIENNYNSLMTNLLNGNDFSVLKDYLTHLESRKGELTEKKEGVTQRIYTLKMELLELLKDVKILERLKLNVLKTIKKSQNRKEQKSLDDMALRIVEAKF